MRVTRQPAGYVKLLPCPVPLGCLQVLLQPFLLFRQPQLLYFGLQLGHVLANLSLLDL